MRTERERIEMEELTLELCEATEIHEDLLKAVRDTMPEETELYDLAELFKVFGDSCSGAWDDAGGDLPPAADSQAE